MALAERNTELDIQNSLASKPPLPLTGHTRLGRVQCHTATPPTRPVWDKLKSLRSLCQISRRYKRALTGTANGGRHKAMPLPWLRQCLSP